MELVAGVMTQTLWSEQHGPKKGGNAYYRALREFMTPYRSHEAVRIADNLAVKGNAEAVLFEFIHSLGPLPQLEPTEPYSEYLLKKVGRDGLEQFRTSLRDLAETSHFMQFYQSWKKTLDSYASQVQADDLVRVLKWLNRFYGQNVAFHYILTPAVFPKGGYSVLLAGKNGCRTMETVIRCDESDNDRPVFRTGKELGDNALSASNQIFGVFMNPLVHEAVVSLAREELYGESTVDNLIERHTAEGFLETRFIIDQLKDYTANRGLFKTFADFQPVFAARFAANQGALHRNGPPLPECRVDVSPEMELLAAVQTQTPWINLRGPQWGGHPYFRALTAFMAPYRNHKAVKIYEELAKHGFTFDAPPGFIRSLGPLPELKVVDEYAAYVVERAGGYENLERFRVALKDLAARSHFLDFIQAWQGQFDWYESQVQLGCDFIGVTDWLGRFFGWNNAGYAIILAPAMYPGGGYGVIRKTTDGQTIAEQIVRSRDWNESPSFPCGAEMEALSLHEFGHSFVNPALEAHQDNVTKLEALYRPISSRMVKMNYGDLHVFMNEQVLRAVVCVAKRERMGEETFRAEVDAQVRSGFYLTPFVIEQLDYYAARRGQFPTFHDFAPYLLDRLEEYQAKQKG